MEISIRQSRREDLDALMELWLNGNLDAHPFVAPAYWKENAPAVREQLLQAEPGTIRGESAEGGRLTEIFVAAAEDGGPAGFIGIVNGFIAGLFVAGGLRSQGIGRLLIDAAKQRHLLLELHVYRKNQRALQFYMREGFAAEGSQIDPATGEEELTMIWSSRPGR